MPNPVNQSGLTPGTNPIKEDSAKAPSRWEGGDEPEGAETQFMFLPLRPNKNTLSN